MQYVYHTYRWMYKNNAGHEELSICFRYVNDDEEVQEGFYKLTRMRDFYP